MKRLDRKQISEYQLKMLKSATNDQERLLAIWTVIKTSDLQVARRLLIKYMRRLDEDASPRLKAAAKRYVATLERYYGLVLCDEASFDELESAYRECTSDSWVLWTPKRMASWNPAEWVEKLIVDGVVTISECITELKNIEQEEK